MISVWPTISIPTALLNLAMEYLILTRRKTPAVHIIVRSAHLILLVAAVALLYRFSDLSAPYGNILRYIISTSFILPCLYLFAESLPQKVFLFFMNWGFTTFISAICVWIANRSTTDTMAYAVVAALYLAIFLLVIPLYIKYWRQGIRRLLFLFEYGNPVYVMLPVLSFILLSTIFSPLLPPESLFSFANLLLFETMILFTYYLLFSHFFAVYDRMRTLDDFRNAERQLDLQKRYYGEVDKGIRQQQHLIHDTRHHLAAISTLAKAGETGAIGPYVDQLLDHFGRSFVKRYCENAAANAIIGGYIEIAERQDIAVSTDIDLPQDVGVDEYELCALFGNAIENSIEACQRIPSDSELYARRFISIKSKAEKGRLIIRIENSFKDDRKNPDGGFPSSKGTFGGVGLESVRTVVERYRGCLNYERKGDVFALSAVLCPRNG